MADHHEAESGSPTERARTPWWRHVALGLCLVLLAVTAPLAVVATWVHDEVSDTDRYVATVAPLAHDPAIQAAVTARITDTLVSRIDVQGVSRTTTDALAQRVRRPAVAGSLRALATPLANAITGFIHTQVGRLVRSDAFADAWKQANREAHGQMLAVLTGRGGTAVQVEGNAVQLNLAIVIDAVKTQLSEAGFRLADRVPDVTAQFTLFESADIAKAQHGFRLLSATARILPIVALLLLGGAVLAARRRRTGLIVASLVVAGSMVVLGLALNVFRGIYLDAVPADRLPADAAGAVYDQLVRFIRLNVRALLVLFLAVAAVGWLTGPASAAVTTRHGATRILDSVRHRSDEWGLDPGPVGAFLGRNRGVIRGVVAGCVVLLYVLADHPTGAYTLTLLIAAGLFLLVVELLARTPVSPPVDEGR